MRGRIIIAPPAHPGILGALFLIFLAPLLVAFVLPGALTEALSPLGITWLAPAMLLLLALSPILGYLNLVVARRRSIVEVLEVEYVVIFGLPVPVARPRLAAAESLIALNVGGALVPLFLASTMTWAAASLPRSWDLIAAIAATTAIVMALTYRTSRVIGGVGVVVPAFMPPLAALISSMAMAIPLGLQAYVPAISYAGAVYGTILGADVLNIWRRGDALSAWLISIGGAGTFDGIFVSGILSMLLSELII